MSSFLIRGLARYFAASKMASSSSSFSSSIQDHAAIDVMKGVNAWNEKMRWLIPFVQATGYRIVIENPKSYEQIVIDRNSSTFPYLSEKWLRRYDNRELDAWMTKKKEEEDARRIAEARGRAKFGNSYTPTEQDIQDARNINTPTIN